MFNVETGIVPESFSKIMDRYRQAYNEVFKKDMSEKEFENSNWWKFFSIEAQQVIRYQTQMSNIFNYYAEYITTLNNLVINQPKTTLYALQEDLIESLGYDVGIRWNSEDNAGQLAIYLDTELDENGDLPQEDKDKISDIIQERAVTGYHYIGNIEWTTSLKCNQQKWYIRVNIVENVPISVRCTFTPKIDATAPDINELREMILANFKKYITIGKRAELTKVVNYEFCSWAGLIKLEQSLEIKASTQAVTNWQDYPLEPTYSQRFTLKDEDLIVTIL